MLSLPTHPPLAVVVPPTDSRYRLLCDIANQLASETRPGELLARIVAAAAEVLAARASALMLLDRDGQTLSFKVAFGEKSDQLRGMRLPLDDQTIAGWVARHGTPLIVNDVQISPLFSGVVDRTVNFQTQGVICVPLRVQERVIGVLEVLNKADGGPFTTDDSELLAALAGNAAVAIENARLHQATRRRLEKLQRTYQGTMYALVAQLDSRDNATAGHSQRVVLFSRALAHQMGITDRKWLRELEYGALLHDVGKIGIPDAVLRKPGSYTDEEWTIMRQHPLLGYQMLRDIDFLRPALPVVRHHHERWDGGGYPDGLEGEAIPLHARIFAVADVFDALTSARVYHPPRPYTEATDYIGENRARHFDPQVVDAFCAIPEGHWDALRAEVEARPGVQLEVRPRKR